jgi:hypothetical protein
MKPRAHILKCLMAALLPMAVAGPLALSAAPPAQPAKLVAQESVFAYPDNASEGRDPFFPDSTRVYASNPDAQAHGPAVTDLVVKAIMGTYQRPFAIINNHTFAPGDDEDVITKSGQRLSVHCVSINAKTGTVTIEANGTTVVLTLSQGP